MKILKCYGIKRYIFEMLGPIVDIQLRGKTCILMDIRTNSSGQECDAKGRRKKEGTRFTTKVEQEVMTISSNNWSHRNNKNGFKEEIWSCSRKTCNMFATQDSYTWNITYYKERTAV